jgi:hypothetical protein
LIPLTVIVSSIDASEGDRVKKLARCVSDGKRLMSPISEISVLALTGPIPGILKSKSHNFLTSVFAESSALLLSGVILK